MFWHGPWDLLRILVIAPLAYAALILILRISGKRMLSKMSAFDLVVTIALGSTLSSALLSKDVSFSEGALGLGVLIGLQYIVAWTSTRSPRVNRLVKAEPSLLVYQGRVIEQALRKENVSRDAVLSSVRSAGYGSFDEVEAVVLETDGSISVLKAGSPPQGLTLPGSARRV